MGSFDDATMPNVYTPKNVDIPFSGTIQDPFFDTDPTWQFEGDSPTFLYLPLNHPDPADEDEPFTVRVSLGKGWESDDNKEIYNTAGKTKFASNSHYGVILDWVKESGGRDLLTALENRGGDPMVADVWNGLTFNWGVDEYQTQNGKRARLVPVEFLGADGEVDESGSMSSEELNEALRNLASESKNQKSFVLAAMKLKAVQNDDELKDNLPTLYKELTA